MNFTPEECHDYLKFICGLEADVLLAAKSAQRLIQFAPPERQETIREISKFLTMFACTVIHNEAVIVEMLYGDTNERAN